MPSRSAHEVSSVTTATGHGIEQALSAVQLRSADLSFVSLQDRVDVRDEGMLEYMLPDIEGKQRSFRCADALLPHCLHLHVTARP